VCVSLESAVFVISNTKQADAVAKFLLDVAKGILLGAGGFSTGVLGLPPILRTVYLVGGLILAYVCIKTALPLLEE
jgi:hypothetical protein